MKNKAIATIVALLAVAAVGGVGYAAYEAQAGIQITASSGSVGPLSWTNPGGYASPPCPTPTIDDGVLEVVASGLGPSEYCGFEATLVNGGNLPGTLTELIVDTGLGCTAPIPVTDDISGGIIPGGGDFLYVAEVGPAATFETCTMLVFITATAY
jgi:hypothetical protein